MTRAYSIPPRLIWSPQLLLCGEFSLVLSSFADTSKVDNRNTSGHRSFLIMLPIENNENSHAGTPLDQDANGGYDEETALRHAISLSLQDVGLAPDTHDATVDRQAPGTTLPSTDFGGVRLDRRKMEEERLARQRKRTADEAGMSCSPPRPKPAIHKPSPPRESRGTRLATAHIPQVSKHDATLPFARGVVKRTRVAGLTRGTDDITLEEILDKERLEMAVLTSFQWDEQWLLSKIDPVRTRMVLIAYASSEAQKQSMQNNVPSDCIRFCFPPMGTMGHLHSKLQILKFESHLRIVIPTGNLVPYDWGESGELENMVFLIDLPRLGGAETVEIAETCFQTELLRFLRAQNLDENIVKSIGKYDFAETTRYRFVHTIAGSHSGSDQPWQHTGYCGLGKAVTSLGLATERPVIVDYVTSSLGSLNHSYLESIYNACQGDTGMKEYEARQPMSRRRKGEENSAGHQDEDSSPLADLFRIYFPTESTIASSRGGRSASGTICFQEKWWKSSTFPRESMRDSVCTKRGVLMHTKLILVRGREHERKAGSPAWAYIGSANLSESAWGRLVKDRGSGQVKLNCRNWECGVLVPATSRGESGIEKGDPIGLHTFTGTVPVPMQTPAAAYGASSRPWFFSR
ncbi:phospholipase D/nuclease [Sodiomyces alkalinus F11]|uniref:Phospholipase D/nuclease n=1 Tax=Sodiomyces alkalinus (strain CBS 110278 / VKM F-3762 / F11) TaxID=1314773 RepID=A0A3N2PWG3_SODAK|nr:phospholipase D/nuclease [Sodiomyces alkalinus F11]ROT38834.1 phospholipase D/nuclease [Sodiomyces alkalinus F11]